MGNSKRKLGRALKRAGQVLLCAGAIAGGAGVAAATAPPAPTTVATRAPRRPPTEARAPRATSPTLASARMAPELLREPNDAPRAEDIPLVPLRPFGEPLRDGMIMTGATPHRMILFTFDDGPDPRNTPRLLERLDEYGIKAVFFLTASRLGDGTPGPWQRRNEAIARDIVARGHMVANHTVDHAALPMLDDQGVVDQVEGAEAIFERVLGERTWLVRPPGGAHSPRVDGLLAQRGYTVMLWNLGTGDFQVRDPQEVFDIWRRVLERRERDHGERGGIILLHDTHDWSVDAVPLIVSWLRERNCQLLADGEELYEIVGDPSLFFAPRGEASPATETPAARLTEQQVARRQRPLREATRQRCERLASR